jgi:hypothetical protein
MAQHFQLQGPPKLTQIWIFGAKLYGPSGNPASDCREEEKRIG